MGPYLAACGLLAVAGVAKATRPDDTARALAGALGARPAARRVQRLAHAVRLGSLLEAVLGIAGLVVLNPVVASLVAASYAAFCAFVVVARSQGGPLSTCGCFGSLDTPPTGLHVALDAGLAGTAAWSAADGARGWTLSWLAHQPWHGIPLVLLAAVTAWFVGLALTDAARIVAARRLLEAQPSSAGGLP